MSLKNQKSREYGIKNGKKYQRREFKERDKKKHLSFFLPGASQIQTNGTIPMPERKSVIATAATAS
ncbi:hypothetical protein EO95_15965 [Methanosarcina sp. 1.H.T.1A.1]|uniref:hypothetical protein n=1 Tax=Methanosarcina sp. 1.H.T.1A.1 TaxID=1483602 RepID=UPI000621481A|nr:hypothetical protein [Methanosarcina sp. 1.H.T.1A.1]KKH95395.1 hypothetical protein EO95_15965 [Methanosarcina sp. 1.H.T.1A.1]